MVVSLHAIRDCLEGGIPAAVATCAADGTPNVGYLSQVHLVDAEHVALSFQFFNKTRRNVLANPRAAVSVTSPVTGASYRLDLAYLRTETTGPLFESMKAKLAGIASHTGMSGVFRLQGADVYRVLAIAQVGESSIPTEPPRVHLLPALRTAALRIARCGDLGALVDATMGALASELAVSHAMLLLLDEAGRRLYTVASLGYPQVGVGSEVAVACGVIGVAAEQRTPIRVTHMTAEYSYSRAIRDSVERAGGPARLETAIALPGLPDSRSQLAVPVLAGERLAGVLYVESTEDHRFGYDEEDALVTLAALVGQAMRQLGEAPAEEAPRVVAGAPEGAGQAVVVRHHAHDDSVFLDNDYLIKGVAGAILRKLLREHAASGRLEFCNRELRLDRTLGLPAIGDNLEARLILLQRRLAERQAPLRLEKTGRGRFRLELERRVELVEEG